MGRKLGCLVLIALVGTTLVALAKPTIPGWSPPLPRVDVLTAVVALIWLVAAAVGVVLIGIGATGSPEGTAAGSFLDRELAETRARRASWIAVGTIAIGA